MEDVLGAQLDVRAVLVKKKKKHRVLNVMGTCH